MLFMDVTIDHAESESPSGGHPAYVEELNAFGKSKNAR